MDESCAAEALDHRREQRGWNGEVVGRAPRGAEHLPQRAEGAGVTVITIDILKERQQPVEGVDVVDACVGPFNAVARTVTKLRQTPLRAGDPDHGNAQRASLHHPVERWEDHLMSEITRRPEEHERVGSGHPVVAVAHHSSFPRTVGGGARHKSCTNLASQDAVPHWGGANIGKGPTVPRSFRSRHDLRRAGRPPGPDLGRDLDPGALLPLGTWRRSSTDRLLSGPTSPWGSSATAQQLAGSTFAPDRA